MDSMCLLCPVPSTHQGGVVLAWCTEPQHWILEGMRAISPNSISATLVSRGHHWLLLGTYLSPNEPPDTKLNALETEYQHHPQLQTILLGDLNADLTDNNNDCSVAIATTLQHLGVTDQFRQFLQKHNQYFTHHCTLQDGTTQCSRCNYALMDPTIAVKLIWLVVPPWFQSDHWAIKLQICSDSTWGHCQYLQNQSHLPTVVPALDKQEPNQLFAQLLMFHKQQAQPMHPPQDAWIALNMWALIDQRNMAL